MAKKKEVNEKSAKPQQKSPLVTYFIIFVFGFLSGVGFTVYKSDPQPASVASSSGDDGHDHDKETQQAIVNLEAEVTENPDNHESWIRLGHLYYDSNHPEKAIQAYTKALELHSGDANLLTDLGVMYRRTKQPEKAIETFNKAIAKDPSHQPSRFNKGIVLMYDLDDPQGAIISWEELLKTNPQAKTGNGQPIRDFVDEIKAGLSEKK